MIKTMLLDRGGVIHTATSGKEKRLRFTTDLKLLLSGQRVRLKHKAPDCTVEQLNEIPEIIRGSNQAFVT